MRQASPPVDTWVNDETGVPAYVTIYDTLTNAARLKASAHRSRAHLLCAYSFHAFAFPFPLWCDPSPLSICAF